MFGTGGFADQIVMAMLADLRMQDPARLGRLLTILEEVREEQWPTATPGARREMDRATEFLEALIDSPVQLPREPDATA